MNMLSQMKQLSTGQDEDVIENDVLDDDVIGVDNFSQEDYGKKQVLENDAAYYTSKEAWDADVKSLALPYSADSNVVINENGTVVAGWNPTNKRGWIGLCSQNHSITASQDMKVAESTVLPQGERIYFDQKSVWKQAMKEINPTDYSDEWAIDANDRIIAFWNPKQSKGWVLETDMGEVLQKIHDGESKTSEDDGEIQNVREDEDEGEMRMVSGTSRKSWSDMIVEDLERAKEKVREAAALIKQVSTRIESSDFQFSYDIVGNMEGYVINYLIDGVDAVEGRIQGYINDLNEARENSSEFSSAIISANDPDVKAFEEFEKISKKQFANLLQEEKTQTTEMIPPTPKDNPKMEETTLDEIMPPDKEVEERAKKGHLTTPNSENPKPFSQTAVPLLKKSSLSQSMFSVLSSYLK